MHAAVEHTKRSALDILSDLHGILWNPDINLEARKKIRLLIRKIERECPTLNRRTRLRNSEILKAMGMDVENGSHRAVISRAISTLERRGLLENNSLTEKGWETFRRLKKT